MVNNLSILIIEDEQSLADTLKLKLSKEGFMVETVFDGKQGLERIKTLKPDLVLLDLLLPSMGGEEVLKKVKEDPEIKDIPVIVISNSGQPVEIKRLLENGVDDYIVKANFTIDDILERVYNTIEKRSGRPDVLIAEDEGFLRTVLAKKLRIDGLKVVTTLDGDNCLKTALEIKPKVLVLDLLMPGLSGEEVLVALKKTTSFNPKKTSIIVLSNYSGKENEPIIKEMTQGYFIKSNFDIDEIVDKVKSFLK